MVYANGDVYHGHFKDDKKEGEGEMVYKKGNKYEGTWHNDKKEGKGTMKFLDGAVYEGDWVNDKKQGTGTMTAWDGAVYEGEWANDHKNGTGTIKYANGNVYEGTFEGSDYRGDYFHGNGKLTYSDKDSIESTPYKYLNGTWIDENLQLFYKSLDGTWEEGKFTHGTAKYTDSKQITGSFITYAYTTGPLPLITDFNPFYNKKKYLKL